MSYYKISGTGTVKLTGDYGYNTHTLSTTASNVTIDATGSSWNVSNSANQHPDANTSYSEGSDPINKYAVIVYNAGPGLTLKGGSVWGQVPQSSDWEYTYNNSAALRLETAPSAKISDWRIDKAWDAIRIQRGADNFLIDDVQITNNRDDAVENDAALSGTIRDSLFDGVFMGISLGNGDNWDGSGNTVSVENTLIRLKPYLADGEITHGSPFKTNTAAPNTTPDIRIINSVFAIEDPSHGGMARLRLAWENVVESRGNVYLNLSDTPLASNYPSLPAGFTLLQGQAARDYWEKAKAGWLDNHDGTPFADVTPLPSLPGETPQTPSPAPITTAPAPTPTDTTSPVTDSTSAIINGKTSGTLGTAANDQLTGTSYGDFLYGKEGSDVLTGGAGWDRFVFDTALDGSIDKITDFNPAYDSLFLDNAVFSQLGSGSLISPVKLASGSFVGGAHAHALDANDYVIYDSSTGVVSYDADGSGSAAAVAFAQLSAGLNVSAADFLII